MYGILELPLSDVRKWNAYLAILAVFLIHTKRRLEKQVCLSVKYEYRNYG